ncbi:MAG: hypothetical protein NC340_04660 [Ruminococcus flavefaciens]|nr:hypothetical protein [Ruminococcus flavefaciens]MCM1229044.1 hypothetical protein [Ruminococcus flavefaciens]
MATFYNQATLSYNGNVTGSNITTGEIVGVISANKNATTDNYNSNGNVTYVVNIINSGDTDFTNLTVTDNLGRYTSDEFPAGLVPLNYIADSVSYYVNGVRQANPTVSDNDPLTVEGINVPARSNSAVIYTVRTNPFAPLGENAQITNTATVTGDGIVTPVTAEAVVTHSDDANLAISKSLDPAVVPENGTITYTFNIQNYGSTPADTTDNVIFRDTFNPILNISSVTFNGTQWVRNTDYSYDTTTGDFQSLDGRITVPSATYTQDATTGAWAIQPGTSTLVITGTIASTR